jgi:hypothetical protein
MQLECRGQQSHGEEVHHFQRHQKDLRREGVLSPFQEL